MNKQNIKNQACAFTHGLNLGLLNIEELIIWADTLLAGNDSVPQCLAELMQCRDKSVEQLISLLSQVPGNVVAELWWPMFKKLVANALENQKVQPQTIATYCYNLALNGDVPAYDCETLYQIELEYDCIITGYGTQTEVDAQVVRFFNKTVV